MPNFNSAKEALLHYGKIAAITRGRISADNHAFLAERLDAGDKIAGYESQVSSKPTGEVVHSNKHVAASTEKIVADVGSPSHDENFWDAIVYHNGKAIDVDPRNVCAGCSASLTYCPCPSSTYRVDNDVIVPVYFKNRSVPRQRKWW